jgi:predicted alpha/beta hydrolase family esterase
VVASSDDPFGAFDRAAERAGQWRSELQDIGARGHINADSGLGDWPEGHAWLQDITEGP